MAVTFWVSVAVIAYVYVGYPLLVYLWARNRGGRACSAYGDAFARGDASARRDDNRGTDDLPSVSIVIAARNEGARIGARIENLLGLDYPASKRQIIVVSDGSTDATVDVLERYSRDVIAIAVPPSGKALALNVGVLRATSDIVVFADARQVFAADALRELVAPFADGRIGAVTGELLLDAESPCRRRGRDRRTPSASPVASGFSRMTASNVSSVAVSSAAVSSVAAVRLKADATKADATETETEDRRVGERRRTLRSTIADGVGLYWTYEKQLRRFESAVDSTLGATGAIYAIRRSLWRPLPAGTILDDVLTPMRAVLAGSRVVFNERACAFDRAAVDSDAEARRKIRTLAGNYQILGLEPRLLSPWANRVWLQYMSHKVGRLAVPYALLTMFAASLVLSATNVFYQLVLGGQVLFYLLAGCGALLELRGRRAFDVPSLSEGETRVMKGVA
jgi:cellulose synthase/poly-beta-1,6-N-acetylglucosamine synthase-like glycosyltransferase